MTALADLCLQVPALRCINVLVLVLVYRASRFEIPDVEAALAVHCRDIMRRQKLRDDETPQEQADRVIAQYAWQRVCRRSSLCLCVDPLGVCVVCGAPPGTCGLCGT